RRAIKMKTGHSRLPGREKPKILLFGHFLRQVVLTGYTTTRKGINMSIAYSHMNNNLGPHPATVPYALFKHEQELRQREQELRQREQELRQREQELRQQDQERNRELDRFVRWEDQLFSNPHISGNHKLEIRATKRAVQRAQTKDEQGRARINLT